MPPGSGASRTWLLKVSAIDATVTAAVRPSRKATAQLRLLPPAFLCPVVHVRPTPQARLWPRQRHESNPLHSLRPSWRSFTTAIDTDATPAAHSDPRTLPLQCPGCGAFSQTTQPKQPGYYDLQRKVTQAYLGLPVVEKKRNVRAEADRVVEEALRRLEEQQGGLDVHLEALRGRRQREEQQKEEELKGQECEKGEGDSVPLCQRCHNLLHHNDGTPVAHPDIDALRDTLDESPYKYNHVYHVLDAADFPRSLLPRIHELLDTMPLRSRNRRARQQGKFYHGRRTTLNFVVTRADLLAPRKEQVDRLMPWLRETLRDALGRHGRHARLGNVRCVSARRGWWTRELREEIFAHGGACWLVGKANVGKSYLVHHVFPKGRMAGGGKAATKTKTKKKDDIRIQVPHVAEPIRMWETTTTGHYTTANDEDAAVANSSAPNAAFEADLAADLAAQGVAALLPPRPLETNYPPMPVVSALPGTTASPIRIPFGGGRGELIDLPGLARTGLVDLVDPMYHDALVMKLPVRPVQQVLTSTAQSLLLAGCIRITPRTPDIVFLAYNFTPLPAHRTATYKAAAIQEQRTNLHVPNWAAPGVGARMRLAGSFELRHDVTRARTGPLLRRDAVHLHIERLPYRVVGLDLLIEGCGWVELAAQVRTRQLFASGSQAAREEDAKDANDAKENATTGTTYDRNGLLQSLDLLEPPEDGKAKARAALATAQTKEVRVTDSLNYPVVDVYSPDGKFVTTRRPLNAWILAQPKASVKHKRLRMRPRKSMKGAKKEAKAARWAAEETQHF